MKARITFILLSSAIVALLVLCAWFTMQIFSTDISGEFYTPAEPSAPVDPVSVSQEESVTLTDKPKTGIQPAIRPVPEAKPPSEPLQKLEFAGTVSQITGDAYKNRASGSRIKLSLNDQILLNDHIETAPNARLLITFADNTQLSLGEKTSCIIDEFLLDKSGSTDSAFGMRLIQGVCRIVTGLVTTLSPDRFKVETRMATIGIRGCDLAFSAAAEEEKIFILGLGRTESVELTSSPEGAMLRDIQTGKEDADIKTSSLVVYDPGTVVILSKGLGRTVRPANPAELRDLTAETSPLKAAVHNPKVNQHSTTFVVSPQTAPDGENTK